jgi:hypothetical protein
MTTHDFPTVTGPEYSPELSGSTWENYSRLSAIKGILDDFARDVARRQVDEGEPVEHAVLQFTSWLHIETERSFADATIGVRTDNLHDPLNWNQLVELLIQAECAIGAVAAEAGRIVAGPGDADYSKRLKPIRQHIVDATKKAFDTQALMASWNAPTEDE